MLAPASNSPNRTAIAPPPPLPSVPDQTRSPLVPDSTGNTTSLAADQAAFAATHLGQVNGPVSADDLASRLAAFGLPDGPAVAEPTGAPSSPAWPGPKEAQSTANFAARLAEHQQWTQYQLDNGASKAPAEVRQAISQLQDGAAKEAQDLLTGAQSQVAALHQTADAYANQAPKEAADRIRAEADTRGAALLDKALAGADQLLKASGGQVAKVIEQAQPKDKSLLDQVTGAVGDAASTVWDHTGGAALNAAGQLADFGKNLAGQAGSLLGNLKDEGDKQVDSFKEWAGAEWEAHKPDFFQPLQNRSDVTTPHSEEQNSEAQAEQAAAAKGDAVANHRRATQADVGDPQRLQDVEKALAGPPGVDREQYAAVQSKLAQGTDVQAQYTLQRMAIEGRLPGPADLATGKSLLENLDLLAGKPLAPGIDGTVLLGDVVKETFDPTHISQGGFNSCGAGSAQMVLATVNPAEYVRIATGLASAPSGSVKTQSGQELQRRDDWHTDFDEDSRSLTGALMQPAFMQAMNFAGGLGNYDNKCRPGQPFAGDGVSVGGGIVVPGVAPEFQAGLLSSLTGMRYDAELNAPGLPDAVRGVLGLGKVNPWLDASPTKPVTVALNYYRSDGRTPEVEPHYIAVTGYDATTGYVTYLNPWGAKETMPESELRSHMIGSAYPAG